MTMVFPCPLRIGVGRVMPNINHNFNSTNMASTPTKKCDMCYNPLSCLVDNNNLPNLLPPFQLPCEHTMHYSCVVRWYSDVLINQNQIKYRCPVCNQDMDQVHIFNLKALLRTTAIPNALRKAAQVVESYMDGEDDHILQQIHEELFNMISDYYCKTID